MCGIFGVSGSSVASGATVLKGLKALEYRGYDSWGVAVRTARNDVFICKDVGKISQVHCDFPDGVEAFGHSRWATHGGVTKANAHPHVVGGVTLIHNGICENYRELKEKYPTTYASETDTEVMASLLAAHFATGKTPEECMMQMAKEVEGRYAVLAFFEGRPGICAARKGSPLIIGRGEHETYIASDIPAFLPYTKNVNYLDDNEMVRVVGAEVEFLNLQSGKAIDKRTIAVPWEAEDATKGDHPHFMIKEIREQKSTIASAINQSNDKLKAAAKMMKEAKGVYAIACGTANKAAMAGEYFFANIAGRKVNVVPASEMSSFLQFVREGTLLLAVSQSGETADVMEVLEIGKNKGAKILAMTNVESSSMARMADVHLPLQTGPEKAVASTKAATAQMAILFLLAYADAGRVNEGRELLSATAGAINDMLNPRFEERIEAISKKLAKHENMFIIGRNTLYPMALEASIKIQEVSYVHAQGFAAGELKHGPIALITEGAPVLVLGDDPETLSNAMEVKSRGAWVIGVSCIHSEVFDEWIRVPDCDEAQCISTVIPVQILSYHMAVERGLDPDQPRNLAKSVTVK